jgi:hypothetical protein
MLGRALLRAGGAESATVRVSTVLNVAALIQQLLSRMECPDQADEIVEAELVDVRPGA